MTKLSQVKRRKQTHVVTVRTYKGASMLTKNHAIRDELAIAMLERNYSLADVSAATNISERHVARMFTRKLISE